MPAIRDKTSDASDILERPPPATAPILYLCGVALEMDNIRFAWPLRSCICVEGTADGADIRSAWRMHGQTRVRRQGHLAAAHRRATDQA